MNLNLIWRTKVEHVEIEVLIKNFYPGYPATMEDLEIDPEIDCYMWYVLDTINYDSKTEKYVNTQIKVPCYDEMYEDTELYERICDHAANLCYDNWDDIIAEDLQ